MDTESSDAPATRRAIVLYASMFGATEMVAEQLADELSARLGSPVAARDITWFDLQELTAYDLIVIGSSTWNVGQLPSDLKVKLPQLAELDLTGKRIALFGTGDQLGYPDTYLDAVGIIADALLTTGARLIGSTTQAGYRFSDSLALRGGRLLGLAVDEDNEPELTLARLVAWVDQLLVEAREDAGSQVRCGTDDNQRRACAQPAGPAAPPR